MDNKIKTDLEYVKFLGSVGIDRLKKSGKPGCSY